MGNRRCGSISAKYPASTGSGLVSGKREAFQMNDILTIIVVVVIVLFVLGYFGRGRFRS